METFEAVPLGGPVTEVGEGPAYDADTGALTWVDITGGRLYEASFGDRLGQVHTLDAGRHLGAAVPLADRSGWLVAAAQGIGVLRRNGEYHSLTETEPDTSTRMNDAKCDPDGRFWAGTKAYDDSPGAGKLYRYADGVLSTVLSGTTNSNGLGWSRDGTVMYFIDSGPGTLSAFTVDGGEPHDRRLLAQVTDGTPDGLAVDDDDCPWVAIWGGYEVRRYSPAGDLLARVRVPVAQPTSCCFAGPDHDRLVITTAGYGRSPTELAGEPNSGRLFVARPGVRGPAAAPYMGTIR